MISDSSGGKWKIWIDRGGTFTDLLAQSPDGNLLTHKLLSENPEQYDDAAIQGIRNLLNLKKQQTIPESIIEEVKMGTTEPIIPTLGLNSFIFSNSSIILSKLLKEDEYTKFILSKMPNLICVFPISTVSFIYLT